MFWPCSLYLHYDHLEQAKTSVPAVDGSANDGLPCRRMCCCSASLADKRRRVTKFKTSVKFYNVAIVVFAEVALRSNVDRFHQQVYSHVVVKDPTTDVSTFFIRRNCGSNPRLICVPAELEPS